MKLKKWRFLIAALLLGGLSTAVAYGLVRFSDLLVRSPLKGLENQLTDLAFQARPVNSAHKILTPDDIVIIDVDDISIEKLGRNQMWPRSFDARVVDYLASGNPSAIAIDFLYTEPDSFPDIYEELLIEAGFDRPRQILSSLSTDEKLSNSIANAGNVYLSYYDDASVRTRGQQDEILQILRPIRVEPAESQEFMEIQNPTLPIYTFAKNAKAISPITLPTELDGTVRNYSLLERVYDSTRMDMPLVVGHYPLYLAADACQVPDSAIYYKKGKLHVGERTVSLAKDGTFRINWLGNTEKIRYISYYKVLNELAPSEYFENKYIFIGTSAAGLEDLKTVPSSGQKMPGVEVHAIAFLNLVNGAFIREISHREALGAFLLLAFLFSVIFILFKPLLGLLIAIGLLIGEMFSFILWFLPEKSFNYPVVTLMLITFFSYISALLYNYFVREKNNRRLKSAFGSYVSPAVVEEIMKDKSLLKLGGQKKVLSVLFSDIRSFTSYSENLDPEEIVAMLNKYLSVMSDVIFEQKGTIDKFIGDAIMAIFGAPILLKDHADCACRSALAMLPALELFNKERQEQGKMPIQIGIGINTGEMTVGNIGSTRRFDYTVIGDSVNLSSRLEGLTKYFGVPILVSGYTKDACINPQNFIFREIALVKVKGKEEPVRIFELLHKDVADDQWNQWHNSWQKALEHFKSSNMKEAQQEFLHCKQILPKDGPTDFYIKLCMEYLYNPEKFSPVLQMESK